MLSTPQSVHAVAPPRVTTTVAPPRVTTTVAAAPSVIKRTELAFAPLVLAIERLRDGGDVELPAVVAEGVSREFFEDFLTAHEERMGVRLEYCDSRIVIYECPVSAIHEVIHDTMYKLINSALGVHALNFRGGGPSCRIGGSSRQADASLTPRSKPKPGVGAADAADDQGLPYPNVVIEVAVSQKLEDVFSKARAWIGPDTTVQQAIVVKVGDALGGGARDLNAYSFIRGAANPAQVIDFSIPLHAVAGPGSPAMQLHVPLVGLFFQAVGGIPAGMADPLNVDMFFVLQQAADVTP